MATVRDPAFWRRFSMAVHRDQEAQATSPISTSSASPSLKQKSSDSWLDRQKKKQARRKYVCWIVWICLFAFTAGIVIVVLWLKTSGMLGGTNSSSGKKTS